MKFSLLRILTVLKMQGLNSRMLDPKIVRVYEDDECPEKCVVKLYEKYISLCPKSGETDAFYLRPNKYPTEFVSFDIPVVSIVCRVQ